MIELVCIDNFEENAVTAGLQRIYIIPIDKILHISVEFEEFEQMLGCNVMLVNGETLFCLDKIDVVLEKIKRAKQ